MSDSVLPELFGFLFLGCRHQPSHQPFSEGSVKRCPFLDGLLVPSPQLRHSFRRTNRRIGVNCRVPCSCFHGRAADRFPLASGFGGCMDAWISEPHKNCQQSPTYNKINCRPAQVQSMKALLQTCLCVACARLTKFFLHSCSPAIVWRRKQIRACTAYTNRSVTREAAFAASMQLSCNWRRPAAEP